MGAESGPHQIRGNADIVIAEWMDPRVEVAFTNIRDLATSGARGDTTWSGIPLTDGRFGSPTNPVRKSVVAISRQFMAAGRKLAAASGLNQRCLCRSRINHVEVSEWTHA